jgi:hypothetical protein
MKKLFIILIIAFCGVSCQKDETIEPTTNNSTQATGNNLITNEVTLGENNKFSFFNTLISDGNNGFYFNGQLDDKSVIGKVSNNGSIIWQRTLNFNASSLRLFTGEGILKNALMIAGLTGTNSNPTGRGVVALYDANGSLLSDISFAEYGLTFFNDVTIKSTSLANNSIKYIGVAIGGAGNNNNEIAPYYATFAISSQGMLSKNFPTYTGQIAERLSQYPQTRFGKFPKYYYTRPFSDDAGGTPGGNIFTQNLSTYLSYYQRNSAGENIDVGAMKVSFSFEFSIENDRVSFLNIFTQTQWRKQINASSSLYENAISDIAVLDDEIYTIGNTETTENKEEAPSNGGNWKAGQICKLDKDGNIIWNRTISFSKYTDRFLSITFNQGTFYVSGEASTFTLNSGKSHFGYAWVAKIDPNSGNVLGSKTFGQEDSRAVFNEVCIENNRLFAVGYKGYQSDDKESKAWFTEINSNGL